MSAYKKFNKQDAFITTYVAHKSFTISGSQHDDYGVETYVGVSGSGAFLPSGSEYLLSGSNYAHFSRLVYNSIHHLYYSGFHNGLPATSSQELTGSMFENYLQSSYTEYQRRAQSEFTVISIPQNLFGTHIKPGSVRLSPDIEGSGSNYIFTASDASGNFVSESFFEEVETMYGATDVLTDGDYILNEGDYVNETESEFLVGGTDQYDTDLIDDGNGNLILSSSLPQRVVGNIIYPHGLIIISNPIVGEYYQNYFSGSLTWKSSQPIYTYNYHCKVKESEYNFTQNPSALKDTSGSLADNITGSMFKPYMTTVGLYNDTNELIAVAKLGQPVPKSPDNDTTIVVKLDI